jgi:lactate dehydrogenase-like 2-hydroxyacid dehydrogenase
LLDTPAVVDALKEEKVGFLAIDVYEEEASLFFEDRSSDIIKDDVFARLLTFPNVIVTGHQAFLTNRALRNIAETTVQESDGVFSGASAAPILSLFPDCETPDRIDIGNDALLPAVGPGMLTATAASRSHLH